MPHARDVGHVSRCQIIVRTCQRGGCRHMAGYPFGIVWREVAVVFVCAYLGSHMGGRRCAEMVVLVKCVDFPPPWSAEALDGGRSPVHITDVDQQPSHVWQGVGHGIIFLPMYDGDDLPSAEHRAHIRRFQRSTLTDKEDVALRGWVAFKRWHHAQLVERDRKTGTEKSNQR